MPSHALPNVWIVYLEIWTNKSYMQKTYIELDLGHPPKLLYVKFIQKGLLSTIVLTPPIISS